MTDTIEKALSAEEWAKWRAFLAAEPCPYEVANFLAELSVHAQVAVLLDGEPFGFTGEDVAALRESAEDDHAAYTHHDRLRSIADRIAALLP